MGRHDDVHLVLLGLLGRVRRRAHLLDPGSPPPQPTLSPTITCDTATHFSTTGDCHACGNCIYSPNWLAGQGYDNSWWHSCTITPLQSGWLDVATFDVEDYFDYVTVDGAKGLVVEGAAVGVEVGHLRPRALPRSGSVRSNAFSNATVSLLMCVPRKRRNLLHSKVRCKGINGCSARSTSARSIMASNS